MPCEGEGSITNIFRQMASGDLTNAEKLWKHYYPRLRSLAHDKLPRWLLRFADADDVVHDAFLSFFKRVPTGQYGTDHDSESLWSLLAAITLNKARKQKEKELAEKRGGGRVVNESALGGPDSDERRPFSLDNLGQVPAQELDLTCEELLLKLDPQLRQIALLSMEGYSNEEIAHKLDVSTRTIQRKLELIRKIWRDEL